MLTKPEAERIAAAGNALRPDWNVVGLVRLLADDRIRLIRTYRDTALALTAVAVDPDTRRPTRVLEHGPWWELTGPMAPVYNFPKLDDSCAECGQAPDKHSAPAYWDHDFIPQHQHARGIERRAHQDHR